MPLNLKPEEILAMAVVEYLEKQKRYDASRKPHDDQKRRAALHKVTTMCHDILHPPIKKTSMFDEAMADVPETKGVTKQVGQIDPFDPFAPKETT